MLGHHVPDGSAHGLVRNRVTNLIEKPGPNDTTSRNACPCFYYLKKDALPFLGHFLDAKSLLAKDEVDATGMFIAWLVQRYPVYAYSINGRLDLGNLRDYIEADKYVSQIKLEFPSKAVLPTTPPLHLLPCRIDHNGEAQVDKYFIITPDTYLSSHSDGPKVDETVYESAFRGRKLRGRRLYMPEQYEGVVFEEQASATDLNSNRIWKASSSFDSMMVWNHDDIPSVSSEGAMMALSWAEVADVLHSHKKQNHRIVINTMSKRDVVICDNGTGFVKCGFSGTNFPEAIFPAVVGRPILRAEEKIGDVVIKDIMVGDEAAEVRSMLQMSYPMENGIIRNWDDMYHLWDYTFFEKLKIRNPADHKIMLTEPAMNPKKNREKMVEVMFERYGFNGVYVAIQAVLTLYAQGLQTGVVIDSGDGVTHIVPVYEGYAMPHLTRRLDVAGRDITKYLIKLLLLRGYAFNRTADFETVRQLKEKVCYVGYDLALEQKLAMETTVLVESYTLPDGRVIKVGSERFEAPEALFQPHLVDVEAVGIAEQLYNSIQAADIDVRSELYKHIVLSGGSSMYPGLPSRLEKEVKQLYLTRTLKGDTARLAKFKIRVEDPPRRKHMVFLGGAVLGEIMKGKDSFWVSKKEWQEQGVASLEKLQRGAQRRPLASGVYIVSEDCDAWSFGDLNVINAKMPHVEQAVDNLIATSTFELLIKATDSLDPAIILESADRNVVFFDEVVYFYLVLRPSPSTSERSSDNNKTPLALAQHLDLCINIILGNAAAAAYAGNPLIANPTSAADYDQGSNTSRTRAGTIDVPNYRPRRSSLLRKIGQRPVMTNTSSHVGQAHYEGFTGPGSPGDRSSMPPQMQTHIVPPSPLRQGIMAIAEERAVVEESVFSYTYNPALPGSQPMVLPDGTCIFPLRGVIDVTKVKGNKLEITHSITSVTVRQRPRNHIVDPQSADADLVDPEELEAVNLLEGLHDDPLFDPKSLPCHCLPSQRRLSQRMPIYPIQCRKVTLTQIPLSVSVTTMSTSPSSILLSITLESNIQEAVAFDITAVKLEVSNSVVRPVGRKSGDKMRLDAHDQLSLIFSITLIDVVEPAKESTSTEDKVSRTSSMSSFMETPEKRLVTVSVDAVPYLAGLHRQTLNSRWFTYLDLADPKSNVKSGPLVFNWRLLEVPSRRKINEEILDSLDDGQGISVSFSLMSPAYLRKVFSVTVFVVNRSQKIRHLSFVVPNECRTFSWPSPDHAEHSARKTVHLPTEDVLQGYLSVSKRDASLVCLDNQIRLTPMSPNTTQTFNLHYIALRGHLHTLGTVELIDHDLKTVTSLTNVLSISVTP
ncbi:hypothetical protein SeMB42_g04338 [Synchytrium endobioticum]|uniref:Actin-related protein 2 n=1 Tax=Synchytrium endobioticum TaxID=286115 RepID=A0A507CYV3_9FUNG|nr:hypothetical protein SeMB42_g04338 [Synchytrium endobioticum]